jgi:hypothetical protein
MISLPQGQSPVLEGMVQLGPTSTGITVSSVKLDMDGDTAYEVLTFLHTKDLPTGYDLNTVSRLLGVAQKFEMEALFEACYMGLVELADGEDGEQMEVIKGLSAVYGSNAFLQKILEIHEHGHVPGLFDEDEDGDGDGENESESDSDSDYDSGSSGSDSEEDEEEEEDEDEEENDSAYSDED